MDEEHSATVSVEVREAVARNLGGTSLLVQRMEGGINDWTFLVVTPERKAVLRLEPANGLQLRRAFTAQNMARQAGVIVPAIIAADFEATDAQAFVWMLEEYVVGNHYYHDGLDREASRAVAAHLGEQLRLLHSVCMDRFGLIPPQEPDWLPPFPTFRDWLAREEGEIESAVTLAGIDPQRIPAIQEAYTFLWETGEDECRLCHGDCAGSNILVAGDHVVALLDWEWARGSAPADNIAYWSYWNQLWAGNHAGEILNDLLCGYQPDDEDWLRRRIRAYEIRIAVMLIHTYNEFLNAEGILETRGVLEKLVQLRAWNG